MIQLTKANGLVAFTCATTGRPEHGTKNTSPHSSIASQKVSSNYYKNLVKEDFTKLNLDKFFSSYSFYSNMFTNDLYFIGRRSGNENNDMLPSVNKIDGIPKILELSKKLDFIKNSISKSSHEEIPRLIDDIYKNYSLSSLLLTKLMDYSIQIGYYQQALTFGDLASKYPFNQVSNLTLQALCHYKKGNLLHANELMLKVTNLPQIMTPKNATFMADIENKLFCTEKALTTIKKSLDNFPNEKDSLWRLYVWSHKIGKKDEAEKALSRMRKLYPADKRLESGEL
jgi:tetratricopeptide (TPR) repeat protein